MNTMSHKGYTARVEYDERDNILIGPAAGAWLYVALRVVHSLIHCTYNKVMHRLSAFVASFALLVALWVAFFFTLAPSSA